MSSQCNKKYTVNYIEPLKYKSTVEETKKKLKELIESLKRTKLLKETNNYLHFLFKTRLFRFKDDVEFLFDDKEKVIHLKSQSRIGGFDWNTNRNRMEKIRKLFHSKI